MSRIKRLLNRVRFLPIAPFWNQKDTRIKQDIARWKQIHRMKGSDPQLVRQLLSDYKEFRNLFIYRHTGRPMLCRLIRLLYKPLDTLYITTSDIGGGLYIQHGFATYIAAESIGENCWINQQVTIGYKDNTRSPIIGNNVTITCGAKVLGPITVGDGAVIGANAVVVRDVEPGAVMGGVPARRIK